MKQSLILWKRNVDINLKWSSQKAVYWLQLSLHNTESNFVEGVNLSVNSHNEHQTGYKIVKENSKRWPDWLPLCSPCDLIAPWWRETETQTERRREWEHWKTTNPSDDRVWYFLWYFFMQIWGRVFLTKQTLVYNKLFVWGIWHFVWICKYYTEKDRKRER